MTWKRAAALLPAIITACVEGPPVRSPGGGFESNEAPLSLPGVSDVEYALAVFNSAPSGAVFSSAGTVTGASNLDKLVWNEPSLTASAYGVASRGDITFIGACDASQSSNHIALVLRSISAGTVLDDENTSIDGDPDFINPPWTSTTVTGQLAANPKSIGLEAPNSNFTFADSSNRRGNAASINTMLNEMNYYLGITPQPATLQIGTNSTTQ